jgi:hypothetical protein
MTKNRTWRNAGVLSTAIVLSACTIHVVLEHAPDAELPVPGVPTQTPVENKRYAQIYFASDPPLADVRLLYDGRNEQVDKILGTTPLTLRLSPGNNGPFDQSVCGRRLILLYEKRGYSGVKLSPKIVCHTTQAASELNPTEVVAKLSAEAAAPAASK